MMTTLVQQIVNKAMLFAFSRGRGTFNVHSKEFLDLFDAVSRVNEAELSYNMDTIFMSEDAFHTPCAYMNIHENEHLNASVFTLRADREIPLHDHPGMIGLVKVISGKVRISSYSFLSAAQTKQLREDWDARSGGQRVGKLFQPTLNRFEDKYVLPVIASSERTLTADDPPSVLTPTENNIHRVQALEEHAAFFDILVPPYYPPDPNRDCHYFQLLRPNEQLRVDAASSSSALAPAPVRNETRERSTASTSSLDVAWLLRVPPPRNYCCASVAYLGQLAKSPTEEDVRAMMKQSSDSHS